MCDDFKSLTTKQTQINVFSQKTNGFPNYTAKGCSAGKIRQLITAYTVGEFVDKGRYQIIYEKKKDKKGKMQSTERTKYLGLSDYPQDNNNYTTKFTQINNPKVYPGYQPLNENTTINIQNNKVVSFTGKSKNLKNNKYINYTYDNADEKVAIYNTDCVDIPEIYKSNCIAQCGMISYDTPINLVL
jgi:hypothetical protein